MPTRRDMLASTAGALGGAVVFGVPPLPRPDPQGAQAPPPVRPPLAPMPDDPTSAPGAPTSALGERSHQVSVARTPTGLIAGSSLTPHQSLTGTITPSDLHFERHHAGVPAIDAAKHELLIHGLVDRTLAFSLADLKRFPRVTRTYFIECSGNGGGAFRRPRAEMTPQQIAGLASNTEWTGVPMRALFNEVGAQRGASWVLAEGSDAAELTRSIPMSKMLDDALVVWAQNGEPLRPAQGYPIRLLLPGWEGNASIKWLRRLELGTRPWMTREETSKYTDPLKDGTARQFSFEVDAKSIITAPVFPDRITRGWHPISGVAWSGRGRIARVEVSTNGGETWSNAALLNAPTPKAFVRFEQMWEWKGDETVLLSRATDETGYVQPTRAALIEARGIGTSYHSNPIYGWKVGTDGAVTFHGET
ncbi:MAG: sulfite dehydrogenase [Gemmatimonadota bacterium]|nr:sulfite dehydrogenase [Gemmatimonadota bacterium]